MGGEWCWWQCWRKEGDLLRLTFVEKVKIFLLETRDWITVPALDNNADLHKPGRRSYDVRLFGARVGRVLFALVLWSGSGGKQQEHRNK